MQNSKKPPTKVSNVMKLMNIMLYSMFGFQLTLIITFATLSVNIIANINFLSTSSLQIKRKMYLTIPFYPKRKILSMTSTPKIHLNLPDLPPKEVSHSKVAGKLSV